MDARVEDPESRPFPGGFLDRIREHRGELLSALLTIWRYGRQNEIAVGKPLGSFETWWCWCRDPLLALGCRDPVERVAEIKANDPRRRQVIMVFEKWWGIHGNATVRASWLNADVALAIDPENRRQVIQTWLREKAGTRLGGYAHIQEHEGPPSKPVAVYRLEQTEGNTY